ncbi:ATP binding protein [Aspergillus steynii IBT 23096]|uniref:ATP binding protein n=1 Tax=Aspergillus steynii IBT 23096 TaxID=1392250 RepID=A0A2I2FZ54_9EURO|nr:ATP binding protein [Aspergillus steynii IBT 23096]PLB45920.1 ATP binding protein [Aspergillus steynii IBT 23096]
MDSSNGFPPILPSERLHDHFSRIGVGSTVPVNLDVRAYFNQPELVEPEPWLQKPEIPFREEILGIDDTDDEFIELAPNRVVGPWKSKSAYLKAHYELLREDAVAPLRDAVAFVRDDPNMSDSQMVAIYEKVYIAGITFAHKDLAFRIKFSTSRAGRNIAWEYSSRLRSGSIVALSSVNDSFKSECVVAIVAARPLEGVKQHPPEIDIFFARPEDADFDPQKEWIMVQAKNGYYESVRHTMKVLQKMNQEKFPLAEHICFLEPNADAPSYVEEGPILDIQPAIGISGEEGRIDILRDWPETPTGELDATQWKALRHMLTKRLSIIQGPPGTGKTHVSVVALRIMLANMKPDDPPIIVSSQTNHALDQLLKYISLFEKQYIRVGARSSDLEIKKRTLYSIRQNQPAANLQGGLLGPARKKLRNMIQPMIEFLQAFNSENADRPLPSSAFVGLGVLSREQSDALIQGAKGWIRSDQKDDIDPLVAWLGEKVIKFEVNYAAENFGFVEDEVDLEYEQLKELEAEQGIDEDDYEILKGQFIFLKEGFCGQGSSLPDAVCQEYLKARDLWKVPVRARGAVYNALRKAAKIKMLEVFRNLAAIYTQTTGDLQIGKFERDAHILQNARVIGVTATGLSKYRGLLSTVNPKVVLVEEAAEAIEAPIAAACFPSVQQLILVGDHQQLKGHCSVQDLEGEPFFLDISMFERLLHNGLDYITLRRQRRMAPEIRALLEPIYSDLQDHASVQNRPAIPGIGDVRSFFFSHKWPESSDSLSSKFNEMEAKMIVGLFVHLVLSGTRVEDITILTFYNGQRKKLLKLLRSNSYLQGHYVNVVTVDSYQGEENEVVLLSLVRSGDSGVGFLSIDNRVCVALSRAKRGFYLFGNAMSLACADPLWWRVINIMGTDQPRRRLGFYLPLTCVKHGNKVFLREPSEWDRINGGCSLECDELLECGHKCTLRCHNFPHDRVICDRDCERLLCGHPCGQPCSATHTCSCECLQGSVRPAARSTRPVPPPVANRSSRVVDAESHRKQALRQYQEFANGGAQVLDEELLRIAESNARANQAPLKPPVNLLDD